VDGGVHIGTIAAIARAGATIAVAGSAVFGEEGSVAQNLEDLRRAAMDPG
jgi:ribulose-phosphate 3-epimerase